MATHHVRKVTDVVGLVVGGRESQHSSWSKASGHIRSLHVPIPTPNSDPQHMRRLYTEQWLDGTNYKLCSALGVKQGSSKLTVIIVGVHRNVCCGSYHTLHQCDQDGFARADREQRARAELKRKKQWLQSKHQMLSWQARKNNESLDITWESPDDYLRIIM